MWKKYLVSAARCLAAVISPAVLVILAIYALYTRRGTLRRQRHGDKPALIYGPVPIISIKYMRQAMDRLGCEAKTFVYQVSHIHARHDYDFYLADFFDAPLLKSLLKGHVKSGFLVILGPYLVFSRLLARFDIFHFFFDGGFLAGTPLRFLEIQLLHLAGKKIVVMPYGGDVAVPSHTHSLVFRQGLARNYPRLGAQEKKTLQWIEYFSRHADFIVGCIFHSETLPRWDLLTTHYYPIDTTDWAPGNHWSSNNGKNGPVTVVHAPNHRGMKGTEFLMAACESLQAEGYQVSLRLLERVPNMEVKRIMAESDILAEQFIHGYGLTAMEGMSLGKPVLSNLSDNHYYQVHRLYTGLDECPIVSTPIEMIKDNLRMLVEQPELRRQLGEAGRQYVLKYHSYEAVGEMWDTVYRKVWYGEDIELYAWHPNHAGYSDRQG